MPGGPPRPGKLKIPSSAAFSHKDWPVRVAAALRRKSEELSEKARENPLTTLKLLKDCMTEVALSIDEELKRSSMADSEAKQEDQLGAMIGFVRAAERGSTSGMSKHARICP